MCSPGYANGGRVALARRRTLGAAGYESKEVTMSQVSFDIPYVEARDRGTSAVRIILAIPHLVISNAWRSLTGVLAVIQWFIVLFTGQRNKGLFDFTNLWLAYSARTFSYAGLMFDGFPAFAFTADGANTPVRYSMEFEESADRLTNGLRIIWAIPAIIIMMALTIAGTVVTIIAWFAVVFTGNMPRGMYDFMLKAHRYAVETNAYVTLMTDTYPKY